MTTICSNLNCPNHDDFADRTPPQFCSHSCEQNYVRRAPQATNLFPPYCVAPNCPRRSAEGYIVCEEHIGTEALAAAAVGRRETAMLLAAIEAWEDHSTRGVCCPSCHDQEAVQKSDCRDNTYRCGKCKAIFSPTIEEHQASMAFAMAMAARTEAAIDKPSDAVELCTVCHNKPCDGKSRYCSNECHAAFNQGAEPQEIVNGLQFSVVPKFELIPREAILRLVRRIEYGECTKGKNAWNGLTPNQDKLLSKEALVKRLGHAVDHVYKLIDRLQNGQPLIEGNEDDAAAIMWAGMYACSATALIQGESCQPYQKTMIPSPSASTDPKETKAG